MAPWYVTAFALDGWWVGGAVVCHRVRARWLVGEWRRGMSPRFFKLCVPGMKLCVPGMKLCVPGMKLCVPGMVLCVPGMGSRSPWRGHVVMFCNHISKQRQFSTFRNVILTPKKAFYGPIFLESFSTSTFLAF